VTQSVGKLRDVLRGVFRVGESGMVVAAGKYPFVFHDKNLR